MLDGECCTFCENRPAEDGEYCRQCNDVVEFSTMKEFAIDSLLTEEDELSADNTGC